MAFTFVERQRHNERRARPVTALVRTLTFATLLVGGLALVSPATAQQGGGPPRATPVGADYVRLDDSRPLAPLIGRLVARQAGTVAAQISGPVTEVMVEVGDRVAQSDILARLDTETLDLERSLAAAEVDADQASLEEAIARRILAEQELARLSQLRTSAAFSAARYEDQSQNVAAALSFERRAQADLARAQANLGLTETRLMDAVIRAPYPGVVTRRHTEIGAYVAAGSPVADLVNDLELEIEADVPTVLLPGLLPGTEILVDLPKIPKATVRAIVPNENPRTRTRVVRFTALDAEGNPLQRGALADVENPIATLALAANQSVSLQVPSGAPGAVLTVAKDAIVAGSRGTMVFVAKDGVAESRPVRIGRAIGDRFVVLDGLADGDIAVVRGNERLRPGQAVVPMINGQPVTPPAEDTPEPPAAAPPAAESSEDATQTEKS